MLEDLQLLNMKTLPHSTTPSPLNKQFSQGLLTKDKSLEFLAYMGQPMLYDGDLYVLREPLETQHDYYRWVKGIRVA